MMKFLIETEQILRAAIPFPPPCRGRGRVGVESEPLRSKHFYPHPSLPPAWGKEAELAQFYASQMK